MKKSVLYILFVSTFFCLFILPLNAQTSKDHTVVAGETLYGIARNYQIHFNDLVKANPQIQNNAINIGDILHIPVKNSSTSASQNSVPANSSTTPIKNAKNISESNPFAGATGITNPKPVAAPTPPVAKSNPSTTQKAPSIPISGIANNQFAMIEHVVTEKQTLYAVSKMFNVTVDEIKSWNHLADNNIKVGSVLLILSNSPANNTNLNNSFPPINNTSKVEEPTVSKEIKKVIPEVVKPVEESRNSTPVLPEPVKENNPAYASMSVQGQLEEAYIQDKNKGKSLMTARGTITWINTENAKMSDSYFALHKTAPIGSIVRVTNLVNKRVVFVKVIGKLPETSDNLNIALKLSTAAKKALLLNGDKAYVDIEFYQ